MKKILLIDDDVDLLEITKMLLEKSDFIVNAISIPTEIVSNIASFKPDLIILDVNLPNADGRSICKKLKMDASILSIPIILFSADEDLVRTFQDCRADAFIAKPFDVFKFVETVKEIIEKNEKKESA